MGASKLMIRSLYFWVLVSIGLGVGVGVFSPETGVRLKFLGDAFVSGIKVLVGPLIFTTVTLGISQMQSKSHAAKIGMKALIYFEVVSTFALLIGLAIANLLKPGASFPLDPSALDSRLVEGYLHSKASLLNPLEGVNLVQVLIFSLLFGAGLHAMNGETKGRIETWINQLKKIAFYALSRYMWLAPIGAGSAMAFTVGKFGVSSLKPLLGLMACFYGTCLLFVFGVLGLILRRSGIRVMSFLKYLKEEILLVLGTSSSESALAPLMQKLEALGCDRSIVGLVVPTGYSFNLDGTNIYLTLSALFIAQAFHVELSLWEQLSILGVAMISSKGASGVTGAGFITLAATLSVVPGIPVVGLTLILGIDRFMSEARALTNMIGNGVASIAISDWEGALDQKTVAARLGSS
jgi:aerobic C4-dicarboxylate transport protein